MAKQSSGEMTIIAYGVRVEGEFVSEGDMQIEGEIHGTIQSQGDLRVGDRSKIRANVSVANANVSGEIRGNLTVANRLELTESANIIGDVTAQVLVIAPGARVNGRLAMGEVEHEAVEG